MFACSFRISSEQLWTGSKTILCGSFEKTHDSIILENRWRCLDEYQVDSIGKVLFGEFKQHQELDWSSDWLSS
jgi:hypothetical protein